MQEPSKYLRLSAYVGIFLWGLFLILTLLTSAFCAFGCILSKVRP